MIGLASFARSTERGFYDRSYNIDNYLDNHPGLQALNYLGS
jgi:hypothetical protein